MKLLGTLTKSFKSLNLFVSVPKKISKINCEFFVNFYNCQIIQENSIYQYLQEKYAEKNQNYLLQINYFIDMISM